MTDIDLSSLTSEELNQLERNVAKAIKTSKARKRKTAIAAAEAAVREHGFSLTELLGDMKEKPASLPKYRHPDNQGLTWTGRGRRPKWFLEAVERGISEDDLRII